MISIETCSADAAVSLRSETQAILLRMLSSRSGSSYPSDRDLHFELTLRDETIKAARELNDSGAAFAVSKNPGATRSIGSASRQAPSAFAQTVPPPMRFAIFTNGWLYGFECATAIVIVFYKAVLEAIGDAAYNRLFAGTYLFHWNVDRDLGLTTVPTRQFIPGDCLYFDNPDVDPDTMQWQGENVIYLEADTYYGHGMGIRNARDIIAELNNHRKPGAVRSAYLLSQATRPDYVKLSQSAAAQGGLFPGRYGLPEGLPFVARIGRRAYLLE